MLRFVAEETFGTLKNPLLALFKKSRDVIGDVSTLAKYCLLATLYNGQETMRQSIQNGTLTGFFKVTFVLNIIPLYTSSVEFFWEISVTV